MYKSKKNNYNKSYIEIYKEKEEVEDEEPPARRGVGRAWAVERRGRVTEREGRDRGGRKAHG